MYVVIGGAGDAGLHLARMLRSQGHEIAFIEGDPAAAAQASKIDALVVHGDACDPDSLLQAGIDNADYYIGLATEDSANLASCSLASYYGCGTIARLKDPFLAREAFSRRYGSIGVDVVLCPALITAAQISRVFSFPISLKGLRKRGIGTFHAVVEDNSSCCFKPLSKVTLPEGASIVSVFRGVEQILPTDTLELQAEDELCILTDERASSEELERVLGVRLDRYYEVNDVFIAGATEMGLTLAQKLLKNGISVVVMEMSKLKTDEAAERLPEASVVQSDPLGQGVLKREGIERFDVLMAMSYGMERNIFLSILAKQFGVPTALALVDRIDLKESVERTLVDDVVVPNLLLIKTILGLLKGRKDALGRRYLQTEEMLVKEIKITKSVRSIGKNVGKFPPSTVGFQIAAVAPKKEKCRVAEAEHVITEGDRLFVFHHPSAEDTVNRWLVG